MKCKSIAKKSKRVKKNTKTGRNKYTQKRIKRVIKRMNGGTTNPAQVAASAAVGAAWKAEDMNTWLGSNHLDLNPSGASPSPAGINTRDLLVGGGLKTPKKGILRTKENNTMKNRKTKKIRFVKSKNMKRSILKLKKGGNAFIPDDITNLKNSFMGNLSAAFNGYKGTPTPYQVNHTYPYQQPPYSENYSSNISDANAMYNSADNFVVTGY